MKSNHTTSEDTTADPVDWARAKDIFLDALDLDRPERRVLLEEACGGDRLLRAAVDRLLSSHEGATDFLVEVPSDTPTPQPAPMPRQIGPYEPVERIGEGGHGTVYRAHQHAPVQRDVALKVLKPGLDSPDLISRFADERRFLARMDHPDIVKIFDAGATPDGRLFVAMELVQGLPLTEHADRKNLGVRDRVALVARLCRAVHHAHQRAVMHRDLKPTNILVSDADGETRLRVIDFGIARALVDEDHPDRTMRAMGTPRYMSPEQAGSGHPVDTRTDIYAIGVILCELLTGHTPRPPATGDTAPARPTTATPPSRLARDAVLPGRTPAELRGDLDRIVLKCVAWEPDLRYESASALADDLDRYLRGEPVLAMPPSAWYVARKFASRHRLAVGLAAVAALSLGAGLVAALQGRAIAIRESQSARAAGVEATRQARRTDFVTRYLLEDMIAAADPDARPGEDVRVVDLLAAAAARAGDRFADDPSMLADVKGRIGVALQSLGRATEAGAALAEAIALADTLGDDPDAPHAEDLLNWRYEQAAASLMQPGRHEEAGEAFVAVADAAREKLGPDHPVTLRARLQASEYLADPAQREGEVRAVELATRAPDTDPALRLHALRYYAATLARAGGLDDAIDALKEAHAIASSSLGPDHTQAIKLEHRLAEALINDGQAGEGIPLLRDALDRAARVYAPGDATLTGMQRLSVKLFLAGGVPDEAVAMARAFADASAGAYGVDSIPHVSAGHELGRALLEAGRPTEALAELERILPLRESQWGAGHVQVAYTLRALADTRLALEDWEGCIEAARRAIAILPASNPSRYAAGETLARAQAAAGRPDEAAATLATMRDEAVRAGAGDEVIARLDAAASALKPDGG
ncbi:MAG: serine/threonine protein kinase [Phycisphaeraceae bacterium]|nr:MAG: serine/threonine protein kinase [Phycisphaeraceae bacterium]